jgi:DNA-directed RNA polymerase specialized sigma24 family protein
MEVMGLKATYAATVRRDGRWWLIDVPAIESKGQSATLAQAKEAAREVVSLMTELPDSEFDVVLTVELPREARALWEDSRRTAVRARELESRAAADARRAVGLLLADGYSQADIARALDLSIQRVHQLAKSAA